MGAEILRVALAVDRLVAAGSGVRNAVNELRRKGGYEERLLAAVWDFRGEKPSEVVRALGVRELQSFMVVDENVFAKKRQRPSTEGPQVEQRACRAAQELSARHRHRRADPSPGASGRGMAPPCGYSPRPCSSGNVTG